jgi:hypothetical protein
METLGFTNIHMWYQKVIFYFASPDDYVEQICDSFLAKTALSKVSAEKAAEVKADLRQGYIEKIAAPEILDPNTFETMVISAVRK